MTQPATNDSPAYVFSPAERARMAAYRAAIAAGFFTDEAPDNPPDITVAAIAGQLTELFSTFTDDQLVRLQCLKSAVDSGLRTEFPDSQNQSSR